MVAVVVVKASANQAAASAFLTTWHYASVRAGYLAYGVAQFLGLFFLAFLVVLLGSLSGPLLLEALNAAGGIDQLLLSGEERVAG